MSNDRQRPASTTGLNYWPLNYRPRKIKRPDISIGPGSVHCRSCGKDLIAATALTPESYNGAIVTKIKYLHGEEMEKLMQTKNAPYTLGLDIGMASVGAALLIPERILGLYARTFDKAETAKEGKPLNQIRRDSRSIRRRLRRRAFRLLRLARLMKREGLIDAALPTAFASSANPWDLRARGLDCLLEKREWAAVLYHIIKHRGFQSNRRAPVKEDEKAGAMLAGTKSNHDLLTAQTWRTAGELAAHHETFKLAKRNKGGSYTNTFLRDDLHDEMCELFKQQRALGSGFASPAFEAAVCELLMMRRPIQNVLHMIGDCTFEKNQKRAPKASYRAERFIWLGKLNNLKIIEGGQPRPLTETERQLLIDLPFTQAKLSFQQVRRKLGLESEQRFNLVSYRYNEKSQDPEASIFFEAKAFHKLRKAYEDAGLKDQWRRDALDADRLDTLAYALTCFKEDKETRDHLSDYAIEPEIIDAVLDVSFSQFIHLSQKALIALLPHMERGQRYDEAAVSAGYCHSDPQSAQRSKRLPPPDKTVIRNPVVYRALNQARKLVNAIIEKHGPPVSVHIELARDLSKSWEERREIEREQKKFGEQKNDAAEKFEDLFGWTPRSGDLLKYRLFLEQLDQCPYCQQALDANRLFENGYMQIDHVLPYSRSFDDSLNNKVAVHTKCNQDKGDATPYEHFGGAHDDERWQRFSAWVLGNKAIRQAKHNRLLRKDFGEDEAQQFRDRHLNDTRYICREFKRTLETQLHWHPDAADNERCVVVAGQLTALLRTRWGLLKDRSAGDLHHALDAAVIAAASRGLIKRMADHSRRNELAYVRRAEKIDPETGEIHFPTPWPHFRDELLAWLSPDPAQRLANIPGYALDEIAEVQPLRVSRAPMRRGLGAAHQETIRSVRADNQSAIKTALTDLNLKDLENIVGFGRDTALIEAIRARLLEHGGSGKKAFDAKLPPLRKPSKDGREAPIVRSVKLLCTQKSGLPVRGGIANNGEMLRADIFTKNGKFYAVPVYVADAVKTSLPNRAIVQGKPEEQWTLMDETYRFLFSLHPNDWVCLRYKNELREGYYSGLDRSTGAISLWTHDRNQAIGDKGLLRSNGIKNVLAFEKYHIDLLGQAHRVHHEVRQPLRRQAVASSTTQENGNSQHPVTSSPSAHELA